MLVFGVLAFAMVTFFISFLIGRTNDFDKGKIAVKCSFFKNRTA